jgi:cyclophilin family peptidyl-prolyl cis-trans isomerase
MEGTLGMASSGKDTEGSQWYVTHSPTPHLDSKYANFGFVISGMDVVHKLEVGDTIQGMELIH